MAVSIKRALQTNDEIVKPRRNMLVARIICGCGGSSTPYPRPTNHSSRHPHVHKPWGFGRHQADTIQIPGNPSPRGIKLMVT